MPDHVQMLVSIPPRYSVSLVAGYIEGKRAIHIARLYGGRRRSFAEQNFWVRGYWVSTIAKIEVALRRYIQEQGETDRRLDPLLAKLH